MQDGIHVDDGYRTLILNTVFRFIINKMFGCNTIKDLMQHPLFLNNGHLVLFRSRHDLETYHSLKSDNIEIFIDIDKTTKFLKIYKIECTFGKVFVSIREEKDGLMFSFMKFLKDKPFGQEYSYTFKTHPICVTPEHEYEFRTVYMSEDSALRSRKHRVNTDIKNIFVEGIRIVYSSDLCTNTSEICRTVLESIVREFDELAISMDYRKQLSNALFEIVEMVEEASTLSHVCIPVKMPIQFIESLYGRFLNGKIPVLYSRINKENIFSNDFIATKPLDNRINRMHRISDKVKQILEFRSGMKDFIEVLETFKENIELTDNVPDPEHSTRHVKDAYCISNPFMEALTKLNPELASTKVPLFYKTSHVHFATILTSPITTENSVSKLFIDAPITVNDIDEFDCPKYESAEKITLIDSSIWDGKTRVYIESKYSKIPKIHAEDLDESVTIEICIDDVCEIITINLIDKNCEDPAIARITSINSTDELPQIKDNIIRVGVFADEHPTPIMDSLFGSILKSYSYDMNKFMNVFFKD